MIGQARSGYVKLGEVMTGLGMLRQVRLGHVRHVSACLLIFGHVMTVFHIILGCFRLCQLCQVI